LATEAETPDIEGRVRAAAAALDPTHEIVECDPALADTAEFCAHYGYPMEKSANTILVASRRPPGHNAVCVVLATTRLDVNKRVRGLLGVRKVSFAPPELTTKLTGMAVGGVTPFALPDDLPLYVDERIMELDWVILGGGSRSIKVKIAPEALVTLGAEVVADLANPA
jgi:prolyl-tRNA editing enzyme YbaK/EbsC (Cys-tRNA(Pro) deacylase)